MPQSETVKNNEATSAPNGLANLIKMGQTSSAWGKVRSVTSKHQIETENKISEHIFKNENANLTKEKQNDFTTVPNQVATECSSQWKYLYNPILYVTYIFYILTTIFYTFFLTSAFFLSFLYATKTYFHV